MATLVHQKERNVAMVFTGGKVYLNEIHKVVSPIGNSNQYRTAPVLVVRVLQRNRIDRGNQFL